MPISILRVENKVPHTVLNEALLSFGFCVSIYHSLSLISQFHMYKILNACVALVHVEVTTDTVLRDRVCVP